MWWLQASSSVKTVLSIHQHLGQHLAPPLFFLHQDLILKLQAVMAIFTRTSVGCLETQAASFCGIGSIYGLITPVVMAIYRHWYKLELLWVKLMLLSGCHWGWRHVDHRGISSNRSCQGSQHALQTKELTTWPGLRRLHWYTPHHHVEQSCCTGVKLLFILENTWLFSSGQPNGIYCNKHRSLLRDSGRKADVKIFIQNNLWDMGELFLCLMNQNPALMTSFLQNHSVYGLSPP